MIILVVVNLRLRNSQIIRKYDESPKRKEVFRFTISLRSRNDFDVFNKVEYQESQERHRVEISRFFRAYGYSYSRV